MSASDRRRFFRIDDRLLLSIRRLADEQAAPQSATALRGSGRMLEIERRITAIINAARLQAPAVAELGELLNRKLDHVIDTLQLSENLVQRAAFREHDVNLSACGLAMNSQDCYETGEQLVVVMGFLPAQTRLQVLARVVSCTADEHENYLLHLDFVGISSEDQEFLIQYIVRRQSTFLQKLREERDSRGPQRTPLQPLNSRG
ncbi:MAG: PilZ domain-containing protein [Gammaproteobacteria bacterium]|nr:PilZ domain-containing protein [Gammaproteobacteria bacterium]